MDLEKQPGGTTALMREHLEAGRSYLIGAMPQRVRCRLPSELRYHVGKVMSLETGLRNQGRRLISAAAIGNSQSRSGILITWNDRPIAPSIIADQPCTYHDPQPVPKVQHGPSTVKLIGVSVVSDSLNGYEPLPLTDEDDCG